MGEREQAGWRGIPDVAVGHGVEEIYIVLGRQIDMDFVRKTRQAVTEACLALFENVEAESVVAESDLNFGKVVSGDQ